jgi:butyrate kinase
MAYVKTDWKARQGRNLNKFTKYQETDNTVILENTPDSITEPGTSFNVERMNKIEQGIYDAHELVAAEEQERQKGDINTLNASKNYTDQTVAELSAVLDGAQVITLKGALLTRIINGTSLVARNLLDPSTVFVADKTFVSDINGTIGVCRDEDSATMIVETLSVSPISTNEPTLLGNIATFANLPTTVKEATAMGWNTPRIDDYAKVLRNETNGDNTVEWYIENIEDGIITWGNPVIINTGDYQAQTTAQDSGRVLTGGATAGKFGASLAVDNEPMENSNNLINSHGVFAFI